MQAIDKAVEIRRPASPTGVVGEHPDKRTGKRAVLANTAFVGDNPAVERWTDCLPVCVALGVPEELQIVVGNLRRKMDAPFGQRNAAANRKLEPPMRIVPGAGLDDQHPTKRLVP